MLKGRTIVSSQAPLDKEDPLNDVVVFELFAKTTPNHVLLEESHAGLPFMVCKDTLMCTKELSCDAH